MLFRSVGFILLPDTVVVQISTGGSANTAPKIVGLAIPFLVCAGFSALYLKGKNARNLGVSLVGVVIFVLLFAFNL